MREHGLVEGENVVFHERIAYGDSTKLAGYAQDMVRLRVDLIAAVGAVTARAERAATAAIPIVFAVVVQPAGDELARPSGDPLANMTGVTTFDDGHAAAQIALLRAIKPDLTRIAYLSDAAVSDCLRNAGTRAAREAGLHAIDLRVVGPEPDLQTAFARMGQDGTQALVALENPIIGVHAVQIAERALAQNLPALVALEQAGAGGLLSYGTSLGQAAHRMAGQACRLLEGRSANELPIESLCCPSLVVDMRAARRLGLTVPPEVQQRAARTSVARGFARGRVDSRRPAERGNHFPRSRHTAETEREHPVRIRSDGDLVMWTFIEVLYRDYCLARLQEMRKLEASH